MGEHVVDKLYYEIFESLTRQGPGDDGSTQKASSKLIGLPEYLSILDVGCGTGAQTLVLARISKGNITALDNYPPFIETLKRNAHLAGYTDKIRCIVGDMNSMNFPQESFDVIWSEGAANLMGLKKALFVWKPLLRTNGYLVVSELVWFTKEVPQEIRDYFVQVYPDIKHYEQIFPIIESAGYKMIDYFALPGESWWTYYYTPAEKKLAEMRLKYPNRKNAQAVCDSFQLEIDMYRKYSQYYGYGFYIMRKAG